MPERNVARRVALPIIRTRRPVAIGSSVPACPIRLSPRARRAVATTSCDVGPSGLSIRSTPSTTLFGIGLFLFVGPVRGGILAVDLAQHPLDPIPPVERFVEVERHGRRESQPQVLEQRAPEES